MLVLSRAVEERIKIVVGNELIDVTIVDIRGDKVRLGITGSSNVAVHREEVYNAIVRAKGDPFRQAKR